MELALQFEDQQYLNKNLKSHNPCFYGISFAIIIVGSVVMISVGHNPCFYGISFAIQDHFFDYELVNGHNPCFYGISFAIC